MAKKRHYHHKHKKKTYTDKHGYERQHSNLTHRQIAFKRIYKNNRDIYPLRFSDYQIHHKDGNKKNNHVSNLELVTREEHEGKHGIIYEEYTSKDIWEDKKDEAYQYNFSIILLLLGVKIGRRYLAIIKPLSLISFLFGLIIMGVANVIPNIGYETILNAVLIGTVLMVFGLICFLSIPLLYIIGLVYGFLRNWWENAKDAFRN